MKVVTADFNAIDQDGSISATAYADEPKLREHVLVHDGEGNYWMGEVTGLKLAAKRKRVLITVSLHQPASKGWMCAEDVANLVAYEIQKRPPYSEDHPERLVSLQSGAWVVIVPEDGNGLHSTRIMGDSLYPDHVLPGLGDLVARLKVGKARPEEDT